MIENALLFMALTAVRYENCRKHINTQYLKNAEVTFCVQADDSSLRFKRLSFYSIAQKIGILNYNV
jgi:hypothetical protein